MSQMKNPLRAAKKKKEEKVRLVEAAIEAGLSTRKDIAKVASMKLHELSNLFAAEKELYAKYCVLRKMIVDMASDNIFDIVADRQNPKCYDASKWVVTNYKSDLDSTLESKDEDIDVQIGGSGASGSSPITIRFGKKKEEEEEE